MLEYTELTGQLKEFEKQHRNTNDPEALAKVKETRSKIDKILLTEVSLKDVLLKGPDLNNTLLGVLIRFRREQVDIRQMFYCFTVCEDHRDFLRFLWFIDNDLTKPVTEYRMRVMMDLPLSPLQEKLSMF